VAEETVTAWWSVAHGNAPERLQRPMIERTRDGWWFAVRLGPSQTYAAFHTEGELAPASRRSEAWQARLRATRWLAPQLDGAGGFAPVRGCPAGGKRLRMPCGETWAACGDAAMSLDPLSSQGLLSALAGGHELAKALSASADGRKAALAAYRDRLEHIWSIYQTRRKALMRLEAPSTSHAA
jgi:flavin-dependent dehydrogenase